MHPGSTPFVLGRLSVDGRTLTALVTGTPDAPDRVVELDAVADRLGLATPVTPQALLADWARVRPLLGELVALADRPLADYSVLSPLQPGQVFQSGANYRTHVIDLAMAHAEIAEGRTVAEVRAQTAAEMDARAATGRPYIFIGLPSAVGGPFDDVLLPAYSDKHDWELELAAVIGTPAFQVSREQALQHVAAYTIVNDLSTRDLIFRADMKAIGTDWLRGKNAPGFLPTGPWLVPADLVGDPQDLRITLRHNGETHQDETTKDMLFDVAALVSEVSQTTTLQPGDLVLTGSPAGNGAPKGIFLRDGDVLEGTISGLGTQRQTYRSLA